METLQVVQEQEKFDRLREASPNGVFAMTATKMVYANPAGIRLLGATDPGQVIGHYPGEFQDPEDFRVNSRHYLQALETGDAAPLQEQRLRRIDGSFVDVEVVAISGRFNGETVVETIVRDVSEKKRLANALKTIAELGRATHTVSDREAVLHTSLDIVFENFSAQGAAIILKDANGNRYVNGFTRGVLTEKTNIERILEPERLKLVCAEKKIAQFTGQVLEGGAIMALIAVPLLAENEVVAMLWLARAEALGEFEIALMDSIRIHTGVNVQRAVLADSLRQNIARLESLRTIAQAISSTLELELILNLLLDQVISQLHVDAACVLLPDGDQLRVRALKGFFTQLAAGASIRIDNTWAGQALSQKHIVRVADTKLQPSTELFNSLIDQESFRSYFGYPLLAQGEAIGVLEVFTRQPIDPGDEWTAFLAGISQQAAIAIKNAEMFTRLRDSKAELEQSYELTLQGWMHALELRDEETEGHTERVTTMALRLAGALGLSQAEQAVIRRGALMHDIGKIGIPDSILLKPGALDEQERAVMQTHTTLAERILAPIPYLRNALDIPVYHHERWDGSGYPKGLKGEEIPFHARIFAIVDVWDALTSDRPYRKAWSPEIAWAHISSQSGAHFDPQVVTAFKEAFITSAGGDK